MSDTVIIVQAMNTYNSALGLLRSKGFEVRLEPADDPDCQGKWCAEKPGALLVAYDPLSLLALAALWEAGGSSWPQLKGTGDPYGELMDRTYPDTDTEDLGDRQGL